MLPRPSTTSSQAEPRPHPPRGLSNLFLSLGGGSSISSRDPGAEGYGWTGTGHTPGSPMTAGQFLGDASKATGSGVNSKGEAFYFTRGDGSLYRPPTNTGQK